MNKEIRSKNTYQKGKILKITNNHVYVSFVREEEPIKLSFETFLKNCWCDIEVENIVKQKLESCNVLHNISL